LVRSGLRAEKTPCSWGVALRTFGAQLNSVALTALRTFGAQLNSVGLTALRTKGAQWSTA
jgi:hypothetical protein